MRNLKNSRILVFGASGHIGSELLCQLQKFNCKITALKKSKWKVYDNDNVKYKNINLNTIEDKKFSSLINDHDFIFYLAGDTSVSVLPHCELKYYLSWFKPLQKILTLMIKTKKVLIYASSVTVFGSKLILPATTEKAESPETSYDLAKCSCDNLIKYYRYNYNVNCVSLRFSNIYGPNTSQGNSHRRVLNKILDNIHLKKEITIVGNGFYNRNYLHVYDAAAMMIHALINFSNTPAILIACSKQNLMFKDIIGILIDVYKNFFKAHVKIKYGLKPRFKTDERNFSAQPSVLFKKNFKYKYNLREGFKEMIKDLQKKII